MVWPCVVCPQLGNMDAPVGEVVICFMHVTGAAAMLAELGAAASTALTELQVGMCCAVLWLLCQQLGQLRTVAVPAAAPPHPDPGLRCWPPVQVHPGGIPPVALTPCNGIQWRPLPRTSASVPANSHAHKSLVCMESMHTSTTTECEGFIFAQVAILGVGATLLQHSLGRATTHFFSKALHKAPSHH